MEDLLNLIPEKQRGTVLFALAVSPYVTRAFHAIRNGGGLRGIINSIWFGTNTDPKLKAEVETLRAATTVIPKP